MVFRDVHDAERRGLDGRGRVEIVERRVDRRVRKSKGEGKSRIVGGGQLVWLFEGGNVDGRV